MKRALEMTYKKSPKYDFITEIGTNMTKNLKTYEI